MPVLVIFLQQRLTNGYWFVACIANVSKQFIVAVGTVYLLVLLNVRFSMELFVTLPTAEVILVPCLPFSLCEGIIKDELQKNIN